MTRALAALLLWVLAPCSPAAFVPLVEQATVFPAPANHWSGGMRTVLGARKDRSGGGLGRGRLGSATPLDTRAEPPFPPANKHQRQFWSNGGLLYVPQLLSPVEWEEVRAAASSLNSKMSAETSSFASGRRMLTLTRRKTGGAYDAILRPFQTARVAEKLEAVSGINGIHLSDHPAELRLYTPGAFMEWHQDDQLLPMPQLEVDSPRDCSLLCLELRSDNTIQHW